MRFQLAPDNAILPCAAFLGLDLCHKTVYTFLTLMSAADTVRTKVMARIRRRGPGTVHISKDFLDLGNRAAVDQALSRLVRSKTVKRLGRGLYYLPRMNKALGIEPVPGIDKVARALGRKTGSRVVPSAAVAANQLGLSTQVPAKPVYLTDGRTRRVTVGNAVIFLKHVPPKDLPLGSPASAMVFQALKYFGKDAVGKDIIARLRRVIPPAERRKLLKDVRYVTDWIARAVRDVCVEKSHHG